MLQRLETGGSRSKQAGVQGALVALDDRWSELIKKAWEIRFEKPVILMQAPGADEIDETVQFSLTLYTDAAAAYKQCKFKDYRSTNAESCTDRNSAVIGRCVSSP